MVDVVARMSRPLALGSDTPATVSRRPGGGGANVAAWLAVRGVPVMLGARVGDDEAGRSALAGLRAHGVDVGHVAIDPERPTGTCVVLVARDGERSMLPDAGANAALSPGDVPPDALAPCGHLHLSGYPLLRDGPPRDAALEALRRARAARATVSLDPSSAAPLGRLGGGRFLALAGRADLMLPNHDEATALTGEDDPAAAARTLVADHAAQVVVTLGADGALWTDGAETVMAPAATTGPVRDTTGAGDAFTAGFLAAWLDGAPPDRALEAGNALAFRFATAFGMSPRMRVDLLVNGFVYSARRRGFIVVYDKDARRTFIHVRDMARAFLFGLERFSAMSGGVYNAGSEGLNLTKAEIARRILARQPCFVTYGPAGADEDRRDYAVSYAKLRALGFETRVTLEQGLDELLRGVDLLHYRGPYGET
jgi:sugar/nucleoside kinase (ribokinase family)